jgi:hypothetical protein
MADDVIFIRHGEDLYRVSQLSPNAVANDIYASSRRFSAETHLLS